MKATVAINNFNYSNFIEECVDSVLNQTYKDIELLVIDDGSTDNSVELLENKYSNIENIKIIQKQNGGQLSTFNEATKYVNGDVIFFLDADDIYKKNYIEEVVKIYQKEKEVDFIFCAIERFFEKNKTEVVQKYSENKQCGYSIISSFFAQEWVGTVTSAVSMKTKLFKKITPIPYEEDWITRADDCLVWGSSIFGAKKFFCSQPFVEYRVHGSNFFYGKKFSDEYLYKRALNVDKLFYFFQNKAHIRKNIIDYITLEYSTRGIKDLKSLKIYLKILIKSDLSLFNKVRKTIKMIFIHLKGKNNEN